MRWLVTGVAIALASAAAAGARPVARTGDVLAAIDHAKKAIALEQAAARFLSHRPPEPTLATNRLLASRIELRLALAALGSGDTTGMVLHLVPASLDDTFAMEEIANGNLTRAAARVAGALEEKKAALAAWERARKGGTQTFGCEVAIGESKAYPGESEVTVSRCLKPVVALTYDLGPRVVKSMSKIAVVSDKIAGGFAVSSCINPAPNEIRCGGYPTFMPSGATAVVDFLPHEKPGDKGMVKIEFAGGSITLGFTQR